MNPIVLPLYIARYWDNSGTDVEFLADEIFSTTIHELTHSTHCQLMGWSTFIGVSTNIRESWALGVEWMITSMEYSERGITNYGNENYNPVNPPQYPARFGYQYWNGTVDPHYTSLFINLVDDFNEFGVNFFPQPIGVVNDNVNGYSLKNIETYLLSDIYGMSSLSTKLKSMRPAGVTNAQIDLLLSHY